MCVSEWVSEWFSEWVSEWVNEWFSEFVSEWVSRWVGLGIRISIIFILIRILNSRDLSYITLILISECSIINLDLLYSTCWLTSDNYDTQITHLYFIFRMNIWLALDSYTICSRLVDMGFDSFPYTVHRLQYTVPYRYTVYCTGASIQYTVFE